MSFVKSNWLHGPLFDSLCILLPSFLSIGVVFVLKDQHQAPLPLWMWVVFVLGIDVAHVYSTLFKTYFHSDEFKNNRNLYLGIPVAVLISGILLYSIHDALFWRVLAYVAVFHFIRQQYGFMRLYSKDEDTKYKRLDACMIYSATLYPIIFWHSHPRNFSWFIEEDFITGLPVVIEKMALVIYGVVTFLYILKESQNFQDSRKINVSKNLIVFGTACSWYSGIVLFNGDLSFTITNVVSHGIPYVALIWSWGRKSNSPHFGKSYSLLLLIFIILVFAYLEEGLWAGFVWREHLEAFNLFKGLPPIESHEVLSWLVPLLTLPQATHYVLDGIIWKSKS